LQCLIKSGTSFARKRALKTKCPVAVSPCAARTAFFVSVTALDFQVYIERQRVFRLAPLGAISTTYLRAIRLDPFGQGALPGGRPGWAGCRGCICLQPRVGDRKHVAADSAATAPSYQKSGFRPFFIDRVGPPTGVLSHGISRAAWWHRLSACVLLVAQAFSLCSPGGTGFQPVSLPPRVVARRPDRPCRRPSPARAKVGLGEVRSTWPPQMYGTQGGRDSAAKWPQAGKPVPPGRPQAESLCHLRVAPPHAFKEPTVADDATGAAVRGEARHRLC
jgi:hypothetical protein